MKTKDTIPGKYYKRDGGDRSMYVRARENELFIEIGTGTILVPRTDSEWLECDNHGHVLAPKPRIGQIWRDNNDCLGRLGASLDGDGSPVFFWVDETGMVYHESDSPWATTQFLTFVREPTDDELRILRELVG